MELQYTTVIPTKSRPDLLFRALRSVASQQLPSAQVIVIDDGSGTVKEASVRDVCAQADVISLSCSVGGGAARNIGIQKARCPIIMFLDDDDEWRPEKALIQCGYLEKNPGTVGLSCHIDEVRGGSIRRFRYSRKLAQQWLPYSNLFGSFSAFAVRREFAFHTGVDEKLPALQDWDFYQRLAYHGVVDLIEEPLVVTHAHRGKRITTNHRARAEAYELLLSKQSYKDMARGSFEWASAEHYWALSLLSEGRADSLKRLLQGVGCAARSDYHPFLKLRATMRAVVNSLRRMVGVFPVQA